MNSYNERDVLVLTTPTTGDVKTLTSEDELKSFAASAGTNMQGYGFSENETIIFDDCEPLIPGDLDNSMVIKHFKAFPEARNETWLVGVTRTKIVGGKERVKRSYLNLGRLTEHSFVTGDYPDDFRRMMSTEFNSHLERLKFLRGGKIVCKGFKELEQYEFEDRKIKTNNDGDKFTHRVKTPCVTFTPKAEPAAR